MLSIKFISFLPIFYEEGISTKRYRDCTQYYDAQGKYHCECDENLIDYDQIDDKLLKGE